MRVRDIDWGSWRAKDPATLVFVVKDPSVLLIRKKRGLGAGKINAPGGRLEQGETPLEAAIRETREEVCVTPLDLRYAGVNLFQFIDGYSIHVHVFKARDFEGEPRAEGASSPWPSPISTATITAREATGKTWTPGASAKKRIFGLL